MSSSCREDQELGISNAEDIPGNKEDLRKRAI
jgi:hypothetical protein